MTKHIIILTQQSMKNKILFCPRPFSHGRWLNNTKIAENLGMQWPSATTPLKFIWYIPWHACTGYKLNYCRIMPAHCDINKTQYWHNSTSHNLIQCCIIISEVLWHSPKQTLLKEILKIPIIVGLLMTWHPRLGISSIWSSYMMMKWGWWQSTVIALA